MPREIRCKKFELDYQETLSNTMAGKIKALARVVAGENQNDTRVNLINRLEEEILNIAKKLEEEIIKNTLGSPTKEALQDLVTGSEDGRNEKLDWVNYYLLEKETKN